MSEAWSKECTGLVARFVPTDSLIQLVLPIVREDPDGAKGVRVSGPGSRGRALIVLSEIINVTKRSRIQPHAREIGLALGDIEKAYTRDSVERRSLLECMLAYGNMFEGHCSFMNDSTGRLVTLTNVVRGMLDCVEISSKLLENDAKVGTVGAEEASGMCEGVMKSLKAVIMEEEEEMKVENEEENDIRSTTIGGSVKVAKKTTDLDSDGDGMEDFDVE
jgi:hypothetical protein